MARRLPKCAYCGEALTGARVLFILQSLPGSPEIGWHNDTEGVDRRKGGLKTCAQKDALCYGDARSGDQPFRMAKSVAVAIQARGYDRVVARVDWISYLEDVARSYCNT